MILVTGGTGTLGRLLVDRLTTRGLAVRVLTRDKSRAASLLAMNVDVVEGDVRDASSLVAALAGVDLVISAMHGFVGQGAVSPQSVDNLGNRNLIDAAARAGADFILVSVVGATADNPMELFRAKHAAEEYLKQSGVPWTILRATAFMETWAMVMGEPLRKTGKTMVFGRGVNPINFISAVDVAAMVDLTVSQPELRGQTIELGGSRNLCFNQFVEELQRDTGWSGQVRHVPRPMLRTMALVMRWPNPTLARQASAALVMDTQDMTFEADSVRRQYPQLPDTDLSTALKLYLQRQEQVRHQVTG